MTAIVLYIHIPFCRSRCDYCDFFTRTRVPPERQLQIVQRIISQAMHSLRTVYPAETPISTIYVGGGTPSSLDTRARHRLLQGIRECIDYGTLVAESEITVEVNPEDVDAALLTDLRRSGVNRLSLGVQSLHASTLSHIGRHTTLTATRTGLELIAGTWPLRWSVDVITAVPGQTPAAAARDAQEILAFHPPHVSLYELGIEPGTRLAQRARRGTLPPPADEERLAQLSAAAEVLIGAGLHRYEISSFAAPGEESRHNLAYWQMHPWIAAGPGAVALVPVAGKPTHLTGTRTFREYLTRSDYATTAEPLSARELCEEYLMGGFRMTRGVSNAVISAVFTHPLHRLIPETLDAWHAHLAYFDSDFTALTDTGRLLLNRFLVDAFGELERSAAIPDVPRWPHDPDNPANADTTAT